MMQFFPPLIAGIVPSQPPVHASISLIMEGPEDDCVLSRDNIYEILIRVAVSSLPSCLRVCRSWRRIGYEPCFDAAHSLHSTTTSGFILQTFHGGYQHNFLSMHSTSENTLPLFISISSLLPYKPQTLCIKATAPTHGLLLCVRPADRLNNETIPRYYVTRLGTTPHHLVIPNPKTRFFTHCTALVVGIHNSNQKTYDFKIVRIAEPRWSFRAKVEHLICEVFDSVSRKWRRSNDLPYHAFRGSVGLVIKQTAYWMVSEHAFEINLERFSSCSIFAFNVEEASGRIIQGPDATLFTRNRPWEWRMVPCEESLCLVHMSNDDINIWMMMMAKACDENIQRWEWKGSFSKQYIKSHNFVFEDDIQDLVVLLETIYMELWYELRGSDLVEIMNPDPSVFRMHLDRCF